MQEKKTPYRIKVSLIEKAEKIAIGESVDKGRLMSIGDIIDEALEIGIQALETKQKTKLKEEAKKA